MQLLIAFAHVQQQIGVAPAITALHQQGRCPLLMREGKVRRLLQAAHQAEHGLRLTFEASVGVL